MILASSPGMVLAGNPRKTQKNTKFGSKPGKTGWPTGKHEFLMNQGGKTALPVGLLTAPVCPVGAEKAGRAAMAARNLRPTGDARHFNGCRTYARIFSAPRRICAKLRAVETDVFHAHRR
jgi:hypothetical protein